MVVSGLAVDISRVVCGRQSRPRRSPRRLGSWRVAVNEIAEPIADGNCADICFKLRALPSVRLFGRDAGPNSAAPREFSARRVGSRRG